MGWATAAGRCEGDDDGFDALTPANEHVLKFCVRVDQLLCCDGPLRAVDRFYCLFVCHCALVQPVLLNPRYF